MHFRKIIYTFQNFKFRFKDVLWLAAGVQKVQRDVQGKLV